MNRVRRAPPRAVDEDGIYQAVSGNPLFTDASSPARIARFFQETGFLASVITSPTWPSTALTSRVGKALPESWRLTSLAWQRENRVWSLPRGLRERDFDYGARVLLACATADGPHYLLARREGSNYYVMDPAYGTDLRPDAFAVWAGLFNGDTNPRDPGLALRWLDGHAVHPVRQNYFLEVAVWVNKPTAPHVRA
jgi:hypothetical protein